MMSISFSLLIFKIGIGFITTKVMAENLLQVPVFGGKGCQFNSFPSINPCLGTAPCLFRSASCKHQEEQNMGPSRELPFQTPKKGVFIWIMNSSNESIKWLSIAVLNTGSAMHTRSFTAEQAIYIIIQYSIEVLTSIQFVQHFTH